MGGGPENRCVGHVYGLDGAVQRQSSAPVNGRMCLKHVKLKKLQYITLLHQVGISLYLMKMHDQTTLKQVACFSAILAYQPQLFNGITHEQRQEFMLEVASHIDKPLITFSICWNVA